MLRLFGGVEFILVKLGAEKKMIFFHYIHPASIYPITYVDNIVLAIHQYISFSRNIISVLRMKPFLTFVLGY